MATHGRTYSGTAGRAGTQQDVATGGWQLGFAWFAGFMMIMVGTFEAFQGLAAILEDELFVVTENYAYDLDLTAWGWIHLILGSVVAVAGFYVFTGNVVARIIGITMAILSSVANFFYIPYYPLWSILIIALNVVIIWALATMRSPQLGEE